MEELDHSTSLVGIAQGGEDLPADTEIGMPHVGSLRGLGQREREPSELYGGHRVASTDRRATSTVYELSVGRCNDGLGGGRETNDAWCLRGGTAGHSLAGLAAGQVM